MKIALPRHRARLGVPLLLLPCMLSLGACDVFTDNPRDDGRIVLGRSVDGVPLGADSLTVRMALGAPSAIDRGAGFVVYRYAWGKHAGVTVHFSLDANRRFDGFTTFALSEPYRGKTQEGIGLGDRRPSVLDKLGEPDHSDTGSAGHVHDRYEFEHARTGFLYDEDERVMSITMSGPL